jgi:hypothetical protein
MDTISAKHRTEDDDQANNGNPLSTLSMPKIKFGVFL